MRARPTDGAGKTGIVTPAADTGQHVEEEPTPLGTPDVARSTPLNAQALEDNPRGLPLDGKGALSLFAFRMNKAADEVRAKQRPLAFEPIPTGAKDIDGLLAALPVQTEVRRLEAIVARRKVEGGIPIQSGAAMKAALPARYREVMGELGRLTRFFNPVELYTADDVMKVKDAFLAAAREGKAENPVFTYEKSTAALRAMLRENGTSLEDIEAKLRGFRAEIARDRPKDELSRVARVALLAKIDDDLATIDLAHGLERRDDKLVKAAFATKYGRGVDRALLDAARTVFGYLVENQAHAKKKEVRRLGAGELPADMATYMTLGEGMTSREFAGAVQWMLDRYYAWYEQKTGEPFPEHAKYKVEVDAKYSAIDVRDKSSEGPIIGIPPKTRSYKKYLELLRHEVDQHVRQSLNGQFMFGFGGGALKVDEEVWYEGLAKSAEITFMRKMFGDESEPTLPYFTFAIELAERGHSFVEVFEAIKAMRIAAGNGEKIGADNAWSATYRAFRGHIDTGNAEAYALPKDQAYLRGWMLQSQLEARGLGYLNESAICQLDGLNLLARFDYGAKDLLFPDLDLTSRWFDEVLRPRVEREMEALKKAPAPADGTES